MRRVISILITVIILLAYSCSKPNDSIQNDIEPPIPNWVGEYHSAAGDSAFVSQNGTYCKIEWAGNGNLTRLAFDSVNISNDLSFTDNEITRRTIYTPPYFQDITCIGTGSFATNTVSFHFVIAGGGHIFFSGIKKK